MGWDEVVKKPAPLHSAWNYAIQSLNAVKEAEALTAKLIADGFTQTGPDMWEKVHKEELIPQFEVRGTVNHYVDTGEIEYVDEPNPWLKPYQQALVDVMLIQFEMFIGYQDAANYVVLAGPYPYDAIVGLPFDEVWKLFAADKSLEMSFPLDKRMRERLTTFTIPTSAKRKGAYGKV
jgi:hypothetical protein